MSRVPRLSLLVCAIVLVLAIAAPSAMARPRITKVSFKGTIVAPTIVITGTGFGSKPARRPTYKPAPPKGVVAPYKCDTTGNVGYDYGTRIYLEARPLGGSPWSAGRYRPAVKELDCVGLVALSWSKTRISFRLGKDYLVRAYDLSRGTGYTVGVKGVKKSGTVRYS